MTRLFKNKAYYENSDWVVNELEKEINSGLEILNKIDRPIVTFLGSHKTNKEHAYFDHAWDMGKRLGEEGYAIVTGGGPGIMFAANEGARQADAPSIGLQAGILKNEKVDDIVFTDSFSFHFLFARRFLLSIKSEAIVVYPGGYGTLNELFEYLTLIQTGIVDKVPVICVGRDYWQKLFDWLREFPLQEGYFIKGERDLELVTFADTEEEVLEAIRKE